MDHRNISLVDTYLATVLSVFIDPCGATKYPTFVKTAEKA